MVAPVEIGEGGVALLVGNGLLKQQQVGDRHAVGEACLEALQQWAEGHGARSTVHGTRLRPSDRALDKLMDVQPHER